MIKHIENKKLLCLKWIKLDSQKCVTFFVKILFYTKAHPMILPQTPDLLVVAWWKLKTCNKPLAQPQIQIKIQILDKNMKLNTRSNESPL